MVKSWGYVSQAVFEISTFEKPHFAKNTNKNNFVQREPQAASQVICVSAQSKYLRNAYFLVHANFFRLKAFKEPFVSHYNLLLIEVTLELARKSVSILCSPEPRLKHALFVSKIIRSDES